MREKSICVVYEMIGNQNSIAKIAMNTVLIALEAGWKITVVSKWLDESLRDKVEWLPLFRPNRIFLYQWLVARSAIKRAIRNRQFDIVHVWQPQVAALADVINCQFLTRAAYERHCLETRPGLRQRLVRAQQQGVLYAEDYYWRHWNPDTYLLHCSSLTQQEFHRIYGTVPREYVLPNSAPSVLIPSDKVRKESKQRLIGHETDKIVVGYLGGTDERKGYRNLITALEGQDDLFLLMGGRYSDTFSVPSLHGRFHGVGLLKETSEFYFACDVLVVPSIFEPFGLVVTEAASHGVPIIATDSVGALPFILNYGAGELWASDQPLAPIVRNINSHRSEYSLGAEKMASALSIAEYGKQLLKLYDEIVYEKQKNND